MLRSAPTARVALVHHWLVRRRGGERVLEALARLVPGADLFTLVHDAEACPPPAGVARVVTSPLQRRPLLRRHFRTLLPLHARAWRTFDLSGYDLVLTSDAALAKAVVVPDGVPHVCYCYSPVRYAWDLRETYLRRALPAATRPGARAMLGHVRRTDRAAADRVTRFVAVSRHVAARIARCYGRRAAVVHPPVDTAFFRPGAPGEDGAGPVPEEERPYLLLGEPAPYKRFEDAVEACGRLDRPLVVAGRAQAVEALARHARGPVTVVADPDDEAVRALYRGCRALLFPGEEDFGLVPLEAMACGRPVVAWGRGGATETVVHGETGLLHAEPGPEALAAAIRRFETWETTFRPSLAVARAGIFSLESFLTGMRTILDEVLAGREAGGRLADG